jgi:hypothetical protein
MAENKEVVEEMYKNEGMAIFIKGQMVIGIHPNNLESNLAALKDGSMKLDWGILRDNAMNVVGK